MKADKIRELFVEFFKERNHTVVPSSSLIPIDDPTVMFTVAGMVQFKKLWSGEVPLPYTRAVSVQKCLRMDDVEKVGKSPKYMTFFEMLGNFSFGDYFKEDAIRWGWEFLTEIVKLPKDKLSVSVFIEDEEAYNIWKNIIGIDKSKIYKLGKEDNFWTPVGGRGACGPCSEIYYDMETQLTENPCTNINCGPGCNCNRFIEIWNLVFPQYDSQPDGSLKPLKNKGIDTGMGLERLALTVEEKNSLFELSCFAPIVDQATKLCNIPYAQNKVVFNIIADHIRALTFGIAEGIYPSNTGRGYVLRHILRRAQSNAYELGVKEAFMYKLVQTVAEITKTAYPNNKKHREGIALVIKSEEEGFLRTLGQGAKMFLSTIAELKTETVPGEVIFKLYDTYGFPPNLTYELSRQKGKLPDKEGFENAMKNAREKARMSSKFGISDTEESATTQNITDAKWEIIKTGTAFPHVAMWRQTGEKIEIILAHSKDKTSSPFYGESGGQVGDTGKLHNDEFEFDVLDTYCKDIKHLIPADSTETQALTGFPKHCILSLCQQKNIIVHYGKLSKGNINDKQVICDVDIVRKQAIARNHTATHLLHSALRKVMGEWVHQQGSLVSAEKLRFDFTHFNPLTANELKQVEELVCEWIDKDIPTEINEVAFEEAMKMNAMAIFGEKYDKTVRMVRIPAQPITSLKNDISIELCGGTHVNSTGDIKLFKIISETGIHAGVRRITAITGKQVIALLKKYENELTTLSSVLGTPPLETQNKVIELLAREKELVTKLNKIERDFVLKLAPKIIKSKKSVCGINLLISKIEGPLAGEPLHTVDNLRILADKLSANQSSAGIIGSKINNKPCFVIFVSNDLTEHLKAGTIARTVGKLAGGGGGGKPTIGLAGGKEGLNIDSVLKNAAEIMETEIKKTIGS